MSNTARLPYGCRTALWEVVPRYHLPPDDDNRGTTKRDGIRPSVRAMRRSDSPRWKFMAGAMTLVTALATVAACGSDADHGAKSPAAGPHSMHVGASPAP